MDKLSDREAALVEAARRELAARSAPKQIPAPEQATAPVVASAPASAGRDVAARIAAILSAEQETRRQRRKNLQRLGLAIPAMAATAAILWLASVLVRYFRF